MDEALQNIRIYAVLDANFFFQRTKKNVEFFREKPEVKALFQSFFLTLFDFSWQVFFLALTPWLQAMTFQRHGMRIILQHLSTKQNQTQRESVTFKKKIKKLKD